MNWDMMKENLSAFFNMPVVISIMTTTYAFVILLVLFSKTSLGKKLFNKIKTKYDAALSCIKEIKAENSKALEEAQKKLDEAKDYYERELCVVLSENMALENLITEIGKTTPNKRIASLIEEFNSAKGARLDKIREFIGTSEEFQELKRKAEETEAEVAKRVEEIKDKAIEEATKALNDEKALFEAKRAEVEELVEGLKKRAEIALEKPVEVEHE